MKRLESQFCSELKKSADILGYWFHKISDSPRSGNYLRFSVPKRFDLYLAINKNKWIAIEAKSQGNFRAFPFNRVREDQIRYLQDFSQFGDSFIVINYRVKSKLSAFAIDIDTLLDIRDKKLKEGKKSLTYEEVSSNIKIPRIKKDGTLIWDLGVLK